MRNNGINKKRVGGAALYGIVAFLLLRYFGSPDLLAGLVALGVGFGMYAAIEAVQWERAYGRSIEKEADHEGENA